MNDREIRKVVRRGAYTTFVMVMTVVLAAGSSIFVTRILTQRTERKLCSVVITTDDAYHETPPATELGRVQALNFSRLRRELGCPPYKER